MKSKVIIITGGSFQGKSLIALQVAAKLNISNVISTDFVGIILKTVFPNNDSLTTSTYRLSPDKRNNQISLISEHVKNVIEKYVERGEHLIVEGLHFSKEMINWSKINGFCCVFLDNQTSFENRIILKHKTRTKLRLFKSDKSETYLDIINPDNIDNSTYIQYANNINEIHSNLKDCAIDNDFRLVSFSDFNNGIMETYKYVNSFYK